MTTHYRQGWNNTGHDGHITVYVEEDSSVGTIYLGLTSYLISGGEKGDLPEEIQALSLAERQAYVLALWRLS